jgi:GT2 family glycosyltransferase
MSKTSKVAIVILNWNGEKLFPDFLPSVVENSKGENIEIIVADNGSTDQSISYLQKNSPSIKIIDLKENYGFAEGYNQALKQALF